MGFDVAPERGGSRVRVFIDYASPDRPPARWLGRRYARWCTERMLGEAARHFARSAAAVDLDQVRSTRER
jgi:hypothetical protein